MPPRSLLLSLLAVACCSTAHAIDKWFYYPTNLAVDANITKLEPIWKRAAAAGYNHVLLTDSKFCRLGEMGAGYFKNIDRVKKLAADLKLEVVPCVFPVGYSNDMLALDPNLIESMPVKNLPMAVRGGAAYVDDASAPTLPADFSQPKQWSWKDDNMKPDGGAIRVSDRGDANARIVKKLALQPWRQYHVSVWVKTQDFQGQPAINVMPESAGNVSLNWNNLGVKPTQDWTEVHAVFNTEKYPNVLLYFGVWGGGKGTLEWKNPKIEEVAFVNLTRRPGCPLVITTADGKPLTEGKDYAALTDPDMGVHPWKGEYDVYHQPPLLKTKLPDGTKLLANYYHGVTVYDHQASICMSEPKTYQILHDQAVRMVKTWGAKGYMMSHDEIRVMNWCAACEARHITPGQMLADNVKRCTAILREVNPGGNIYVWQDMFDPNHNAVPGPYFLDNGPLTGSWEGLDKDVIMMPWYFSKRDASLKFFADRGQKQVIAGYYDSDPAKVVDWLASAKKVPGSVIGVMYTTWQNNYNDLEKFSQFVDQGAK